MKYEKEIREIILHTTNTIMPINEASVNTNLYTIGIDSMEYVKIIIEVENKFNIKIPDTELVIFKSGTIKNLSKIISKQIKTLDVYK